jgi:beta-N-acetylhexosaminidase
MNPRLLAAASGLAASVIAYDLRAQQPKLVAADTAWVEQTLRSLPLERKVAQLIVPDITATYVAEGDPRLVQWTRLAREHGVGMFVLYGGTPRDVAALLNRLQREAAIPLLMAADFEGGPGQQVVGATEYPPNMAFAAARSEDLMYRAASAAAIEGRAMGIHLTYTPVVDIAWRPENPAEAGRSFGGDLELLGRMVRAYVRGYHDNGVLTTAKHYPGRGDVAAMPNNPPWQWIDKPAPALRAQEFAAFRHAFDAGVDFVMSEHIAIPSITGGSDLPASVERRLASGWLRDSLGFRGILTTDDLWYDHVVARFGAEEVAVRAFEAGHDLILKPKDPAKTIAAMVHAVRSGRLSERRIDDAARRLLLLKTRLGLHRDRFVDESKVASRVATPAHQTLVQEVADRSLTLLQNDGVLPVHAGRLAKAVNISVQKLDGDPMPATLATKLSAAFSGIRSFTLRPDLDPSYYEQVWQAVAQSELVIISLFVQRNRLGDATPMRDADLAFLERVIRAKRGAVIAMAYGNPHLARKLSGASAFLVGYGERGWFGNQGAYIDSFIKAVRGELTPSGRLPIRVSDQHPLGAGR